MWRSLTRSIPRLPTLLLSRSLSTSPQTVVSSTSRAPPAEVVTFLRLNNLADNPGAVKKKRRVGRGIGSSKGKTCGRGHKGQKARAGGKVHPTFEGGQTKLYKLLPKRGFSNKMHEAVMVPINIGKIQDYIDMGRIHADRDITLREMQLAGLFKANAVKQGVKLLADGKERLRQPLNIIVSRASQSAIQAVEAVGGFVTCVHYNRLALRAVLRPEKFDTPIKFARPPPKWQPYYTGWKNRGYLNPAVQLRQWLRTNPELNEKFETILANQKNKVSSEQ